MERQRIKELDTLKKVYKKAIENPDKGVFTHYEQILKDIDPVSVFTNNFSLSNTLNQKDEMISIMESSINYYKNI